MYLIEKYHKFLNRFIGSDSARAILLASALAVVVLAFFGVVLLRIGAPPLNARPWDVPMTLDGGWRIMHGQMPHRDFFSHIGPLPYFVMALGMKLGYPGVTSITVGTVSLMTVVGTAALLVLRRRTSGLYAFLYTLFFGLLVCAPRALGDAHDDVDYASLYNRFGEAFIGLLFVVTFVPPRPGLGRRWASAAEAVFAGVLLTTLWCDKVNYFLMGAGLLALAGLLRFLNVKQLLLCLCGAVLSWGAFTLVTGIPIQAMFRDFRIVALAQDSHARIPVLLVHAMKYGLLLPILLVLAWEEASTLPAGSKSFERWRIWLVPVAVFGVALLLLSSNGQVGELPLLASAALYGAERLRRQNVTSDGAGQAIRHVAVLAVTLLFVLPTTLTDVMAVRNALWTSVKHRYASSDLLQTTNLRDFRFATDGDRWKYSLDYMRELDRGIALLRRHPDCAARLGVFLFVNPYHLALDLPPCRGGMVIIADNVITLRSHPSLSQVLGDSEYILTYHGCEGVRSLFGAEWDSLKLEPVEDTESFALFKVPAKVSRTQ